ncbi:MAG: hypothetical protein ACXW3L_04300 [Limisphaerales bacterium]
MIRKSAKAAGSCVPYRSDIFTPVAAAHVVDGTGKFNSRLTGHLTNIAEQAKSVKGK